MGVKLVFRAGIWQTLRYTLLSGAWIYKDMGYSL